MTGIISDNVARTSGLIKAAAGGGAWNLVRTETASSSSTISFVHGSSDVDFSTYPIYVFKCINIHPSAQSFFGFNFSTDAGSNYNATKTSTNFRAYHDEGDSSTDLDYKDGDDISQGTGQVLTAGNLGNANDETLCGELWLFKPSSTTYVKHFIWRSSCVSSAPAAFDCWVTGYVNTTDDVDGVQFAMSSGDVDSGTIKLFGLSDS